MTGCKVSLYLELVQAFLLATVLISDVSVAADVNELTSKENLQPSANIPTANRCSDIIDRLTFLEIEFTSSNKEIRNHDAWQTRRIDELENVLLRQSAENARIIRLLNQQRHQEETIDTSLEKQSFAFPAVGFYAKIDRQIDLTGLTYNQVIQFDTVVTNVGGGYEAQSSVFTAPMPGVYVFTVEAMNTAGHDSFLALVKDGVLVQKTYTSARNSLDYVSSSNTVVLTMDRGNKVWVVAIHGDGTIHGWGYTSFTGWLQSPV